MTMAANSSVFRMEHWLPAPAHQTQMACSAQGAWESLTFPESSAHSTIPLLQMVFPTAHGLTQGKVGS